MRPASSRDIPALAALHITCWAETYRGVLSDTWLASHTVDAALERWTQTLDEMQPGGRLEGARLVLAERVGDPSGSELVGFALGAPAEPSDDPTVPPVRPTELDAIYTRVAVQGTGVGTALLEAAIGDAPAYLWVVAANARAIRFYERHGFRFDGTQNHYEPWEGVLCARMVR